MAVILLYIKIIEFLPIINKETSWRKDFEKRLDEVEALFDLKLYNQAYFRLGEAKISSSPSYPHLPKKDMFVLHRYYNLKLSIFHWITVEDEKDSLPNLAEEITDLLDIIIPRIETRELYNDSTLDKLLGFKNSEVYLYRVLAQVAENVKDYNAKLKFLDKALKLIQERPKKVFKLVNGGESYESNAEQDIEVYRFQTVFYYFLYLEKIFTHIQNNPYGIEGKISFDFSWFKNLIHSEKYDLNTYNQALTTFILFKISEIELGANIKEDETERLQGYYKQFRQFLFTPEKMQDVINRMEFNQILISFILANNEKLYIEIYERILEGLEKQRFEKEYRPCLRFLKLICALESKELKITNDFYDLKIEENSNEKEFLKLSKELFEKVSHKTSSSRIFQLQHFNLNIEILKKLKEEAKIGNPFHQAILSWFEKYTG